ncbi:MAG TPA: two-component regulator propeller domain-containing protein [Thermoanaerobaculia bacterium]|nr:two-component regulator propeller domain-containing protein [Thermoanaerobaculia bacterium]
MPAFARSTLAILILLAAPLSLAAGRAGVVAFDRVPIPDDVPAHLTSAIAQDANGLLWLGTQGGLVRYDGYEFRVFRSNPSDPSTLAGNYVRALLVASDGRLWAGSFSGGLSVFDPRTETFTRFRHDPNDPRSLAYDRVEGLAEDREGRVWIATTAGLDRLDPRTRRIEHFLAGQRVRGLLVDRAGQLWLGTRDGLQRRTGDRFVHAGLAGQNIGRLYEDRRGRIWIGTEEHGASVLDPRTGALRTLNGLGHYWVYGFSEALPDEMWVATFGGGIDVVDSVSLTIVDRLRRDATLDDTIGADRIGSIFRDRAGVIWIGTWGEGLARHDPRTRAFRALRASPNRPDGLTHPAAVRAMEMRDGTIWVGTNGNGIDLFDRALQRIGGHRARAADAGALSDGSITCLAQSADGTIWVATLDSMLHRLLPGARRFDRIPVDRLPGGPIRALTFDRDGTLWAGAAEGMARIDPRTLETRLFRQWPGAVKSSPAIEAIAATRDGALWVGTDNGLYAFDPRSESMVHVAHDARRSDALPDNWVPDLLIARDGRLWVGTAGGAAVLTSWDGRTARFDHVAKRLHRTPSPAEALIEDPAGQLWIGPRLRLDPRTWTARDLGPADGCRFRNFFIASRARMRDGTLLFGSPSGLLLVQPSALPSLHEEPSVIATDVRVEGAQRAGAPVLQSLMLSSSEREFTIDVASGNVNPLARTLYRHRLDPLEREWSVMSASQRSIHYARLPPGRYVLRIAALNRAGRWSGRELRVPITVMPAFHQTVWFRALLALAALAIVYMLYRLRIRVLLARARARQIEEASLTDALTGLRNRRFLEQTIGADLELAARAAAPDRDLIAILIDLDHFKSVNDTHGHAAGDAVLVELAQILRRTFRASDHLVRWGGEEFLVVARFVGRARGPELAEKLREAVAAHVFTLPDGGTLHKTCSIGFAAWPFDPSHPRATSWNAVVALADDALYAAKHGGRDVWVGIAASASDGAAVIAYASARIHAAAQRSATT